MADEVAELNVIGTPADELTGYNRARAKAYTGRIRSMLERQGMTDIRFPAGDVDPDRQNVAWFIPKDGTESPVLIGDYRGYLVIMHAVYIGDGVAEIGGEGVNLMEPFAIDAAGVADDAGLRGAHLGGVAHFTVRAWRGGNEFYNLSDDMTRMPETFKEGVVQGVGLCTMTIDRYEDVYGRRMVDEGAESQEGADGPALDLSDSPANALIPEWEALSKPYMAEVRSRLEACGYENVRFLQKISPKRDCAEWYCDSGSYDAVLSFEWRGLTFTITAGGDHTYCIDGDYADDMDMLADYDIVDDDDIGRLEELSGNNTGLEGWCDFELSCRDSGGYDFSSRELGESIGCTVSEALDWVTDPGQMNWFVDEYRRDKERNAALVGGPLREGGGDAALIGIDLDDTPSDGQTRAELAGFCRTAYDGAEGAVFVMDALGAVRAYGDKYGEEGLTVYGAEAVADSFSASLPKSLAKHAGAVRDYVMAGIGVETSTYVAAGCDDWLVLFRISRYGMRGVCDTVPESVTDEKGRIWVFSTTTKALAHFVGTGHSGLVRCVGSLTGGEGTVRRDADAFCRDVEAHASAERVAMSGVYTYPDDGDEAALDAMDEDDYDLGQDIEVRFSGKVCAIDDAAFFSSLLGRNVREMELPEGLRSIGANTLRYLRNLRKVYIPKTVADIGPHSIPKPLGGDGLLVAFEGNREDYPAEAIREFESTCVGGGTEARFGVSREAFRSLREGLGASGSAALADSGRAGLDLADTPSGELESPQPDGMAELKEFLEDVYGSSSEFVRIGDRLYDVQSWDDSGRVSFIPLVYDFGRGDGGVTVARLAFAGNDSEAAAAELVRNGVEPDGIDAMIDRAVDGYDAVSLDSVNECIDYVCDVFGVRDYAGYDDWKASKAGRGVV
jgi:hypothetical protein